MDTIKKIIVLMIFGFSSLLQCADFKISKNNPQKIKVDTSKPLSLNFNFNIKKVNVLTNNDKDTKTVLLDKGLLMIFKKIEVDGQIVVTNMSGDSYIIYFEHNGNENVFNFIDPIFQYNHEKTEKIKSKVTVVENDIEQIIKKILNKKKLGGFTLINSSQTIQAKDFFIQRDKRYLGKKYIIDVWVGVNSSNRPIHLDEEEFYTKGILAIALEKNNINVGETFYLISVINKATFKNLVIK